MLKHLLISSIFIISVAGDYSGQNKFEGHNIILDVPSTHRSATCALRYAPPTDTLTVTDLDRTTPLRLRSCGGSGSNLVQNGLTSARLNASASTYKWCFEGEDNSYRVTMKGDQYSGPITYNWIAELDPREAGFYNVRDFGAVGDGRTDDTIAVRSAMAYIGSKNGGTMTFPEGDYVVTSPIALPSGIVIQGTNGMPSNSPTSHLPRKNSSRITLSGSRRALFKIGECTHGVTFRDIELYSQSNDGTFGVEASGAYNSAQDFHFERVTFNNFFRGIQAEGLPQTNLSWQFDYIKLKDCRFIFNRDSGIFVNIRNSDWKIEGAFFVNPPKRQGQNANSMHFERVAGVLIEDTYGGGFPGAPGGTFLNVLDSGNLTVITSQTEAMTNSFVYNEVKNPSAGDYSYPITFINNVFGHPIIFNARRTFVSVGSMYGPETFRADERLRVYSTGDRFCYDGHILHCQGPTKNNFDKASVIFMTGQPSEGQVTGHPTFFGTDVQFGAPVQLPSFMQNALPTSKSPGSMVFCSNCRRSSEPCQAGGSGAPAMMIGNRWSCL
ncbi:MAG: glycosyl hydrolase family 28-related protein [Pyrinomonadaceae bacterium]